MYCLENLTNDKNFSAESLLTEGKVKRTIQQGNDGKYYIYYVITENTFTAMNGLGSGNISSLKDVFLIDDNLNIKYIGKNGKEYGDNLNNKILDDETEIKFTSKTFSEYISKISGVTEENMKFKWMKNQTSLTIADSSVDSLEDLVFFPNLTSLTLGEYGPNIPKIQTMDGIENCTNLTHLELIYGTVEDYSAISKLSNLKSFCRFLGNDYDKLINSLISCHNLETVNLINMNITNVDKIIKLASTLKNLNLTLNKLNNINGIEQLENLEKLTLSSNQISNIDCLKKLTKLTHLSLSNNQISDITPLSSNSKLEQLDLKGNSLIDGNRNNYTKDKLEKIDQIGKILDNGGTISINVEQLKLFTNYKTLDLSSQNLTSLDVLDGMTELTSLNLNANKLTLTDAISQNILKNMTKLKSLTLSNNNLSDISVLNSLNNLKVLHLNGNSTTLNLKEIEDIISTLSFLSTSNSTFQTITNCTPQKITHLSVGGNYLENLPDLSKFTNLYDLYITNEKNIKDFSVISNISSLKRLNLPNCNLHGKMINFSKLINLNYINLTGNTLWTEDLQNLTPLKNVQNLTIDLRNNSIIDATILLQFDNTTKIYLSGNVNLSQDSKEKLSAKFGNNVTF